MLRPFGGESRAVAVGGQAGGICAIGGWQAGLPALVLMLESTELGPPELSAYACTRAHAGSISDIPWTNVNVGDAIMVKDDELFPADLLCLHSALPDNVCFIKARGGGAALRTRLACNPAVSSSQFGQGLRAAPSWSFPCPCRQQIWTARPTSRSASLWTCGACDPTCRRWVFFQGCAGRAAALPPAECQVFMACSPLQCITSKCRPLRSCALM